MRPNARRNAARKAQASRKAGGPVLPPVVTSRIAEAGASAYQWRDQVLLNLYLPPKPIQVALRVAYWAIQALTAVVVALVAHQGGTMLVTVALFIPVAAMALLFLLSKTASAPPSISWLASSAVAAIPMISSGPWGVLGAVVLALAVIVSAEQEHPVRATISTWVSIVLTLGFGALAHATDMGWGVPVAWALLLIVTQVPICVAQRSFRTASHRITRDDLSARIPPPEFRWEPLAATVRRVAKAMQAVPGVSLVASAFSASSWIEGVIEGPSEAVMSDALKKSAGGYGERKTGVILLGLARGEGTMILHDVILPGAKSANIDHIVIGRNREGKPCAFIIDSKFYGLSRLKGNDPGEVTYDMATRGYVHRQGARAREIDKSISTALWGADAVRKVTDIEDVRVIMAIHNADVAPHLAFERQGTPVEIISAWSLVEYIESHLYAKTPLMAKALRRGGGVLSPLQEARVSQGFVSASTSQRPAVVSPLGLSRQGREFMSQQALQARGGGGVASRFGPGAGPRPYDEVLPQRDVSAQSSMDSAYPPAVPHAPQGGLQGPASGPVGSQDDFGAQETAFQKADREFFDSDPLEWADDAPPPPPVPPAQSAPERVEGRWEEMRNSTPAALDDVPAEYQAIVRGTPLTITSFSDERGPTAQDVVAITGICVGVPGNLFLWFCSPEGWKQYETTGTPVFISTIEAERVIVRGGE